MELLHIEYLAAHPDGLRYTAFCDVYRRWLKRRKLSMRQAHVAGEKMFVDYSGQTAQVADPRTGEVREVQIFVAVLGASSMTFVEATESQTLPDWTASHVRACAFFGGTTGCDRPVFASDALTVLHEASAGRLRDIDRIATAALKHRAKQGLSIVDRAVVVAVVGEQQR